MKPYFLSLCVIAFLSCTQPSDSFRPGDLVNDYYESLNEGDVAKTLKLVSDTLINIQGPDTAIYTSGSYRKWLAWDRSFKPSYKIVSSEKIDDNTILLTIEKQDVRIQFLNEEPTVYREKYYFKNGKLDRIVSQEYLVFNDSIWITKRGLLTSFIEENHPELSGFIFDQTAAGAQKYLDAIKYYEQKTK